MKTIAYLLLGTALFISCESSNEPKTYQCPMKCEGVDKTYDKPGSCPVCKMELKEVEQ